MRFLGSVISNLYCLINELCLVSADVALSKPVDEADRLRQDAEFLAAEEAAKQKRRSQVLQRSLPRPASVNPLLAKANGYVLVASSSDEDTTISNAIGNELVTLIGYENYAHPMSTKSTGKKGSKRDTTRAMPVELEELDDEYLDAARNLVSEEMAVLTQAAKDSKVGIVSAAEYGKVWEEQAKQLVYVANPQGVGGSYRPASEVSKNELLTSLELQHSSLKAKIDKDAKKCAKLEQKIGVKCQGYINIADKTEAQLRHSLQEYDNRSIELGAYICMFTLYCYLCYDK